MGFDPGELYDEGFDDGMEENIPEEVEYDDDGNPILLAAAAGFGYHMAEDELEERQIAENILKRKEAPSKIPLSHRHKKTGGHMTPFARWATKVNLDHSKINDELEYTKEEQLQIFKSEGDWDG